ncbi:MAG: hypothetical protein IPM48_08945 [Saprospiraceae bacterium]|nr:hypothetical protein [Saprospiraceae bacterium]
MAKIRDKRHWAEELSRILHCGVSSIYKKTRQDSFFTIEEMLFLIKYYSIDIDKIFTHNKGVVQFNVPGLKYPVQNIETYINYLLYTFRDLDVSKNPNISYATKELPIFYYFLKPRLSCFKLYVYAKSIWKLESVVNEEFSTKLIDEEALQKLELLWDKYSRLKSFEYWSTKVFDTTLQQIFYYFESGELNTADAIDLLNDLDELIILLKQMTNANTKNKDLTNNFKLYENKILNTGNHILVRMEDRSLIYLSFDYPNFIYSDDAEFIRYSENWYNKIEETSYLLGKGSGHQTSMFFNYLHKKVEQLSMRIKSRF